MATTKQWYSTYLQSEHWRELRARAFQILGRICAHCGNTKQLEAHHIRYRNPIQSCTVSDLVILCHACHKRQHGIIVETKVFPVQRRGDKWKRKMQRASVRVSALPGNSHFIVFPPKARENSFGQLDPARQASMRYRTGTQGTGQQHWMSVGESNTRPTVIGI